ncbi:helix-turn-helix domain-containing protein [Streptomyces ipomoeae]|nr:leucine zipper domain-containing protein [Streptomyces ipomoeae]MDX2938652.1 helix-turn-helix domain-containing protein [Streptomyces ipomoeae]
MPKSTPTTPPLDREAKRRLAVIRHVEEVTGNVAMSCRYFGISRQAYYTWYRRYQSEGVEGLRTRSKAPKTSPNAAHVEVVGLVTPLPADGGPVPGEIIEHQAHAVGHAAILADRGGPPRRRSCLHRRAPARRGTDRRAPGAACGLALRPPPVEPGAGARGSRAF